MNTIPQVIRWQQRLANYLKALGRLSAAVELASQRPLTKLEKQGLIQAFEFTHELAWNVMKNYFAWQGTVDITGSRDATRESFSKNLIADSEGWMEMIRSRNQTSHTFNEEVANEIVGRIIADYYPLFEAFSARMQHLLRAQ